MERSRSLSVDDFKDRTIEFLSWVNDRRSRLAEEEKARLIEGLTEVLQEGPITDQISTFKSFVLRLLQEWKQKKPEGNEDSARAGLAEEFYGALKRFQDALSRFSPKELSGVEEKAYRVTKDLIRSQISILTGNALEESEDMR